jgi:hypothetical protein
MFDKSLKEKSSLLLLNFNFLAHRKFNLSSNTAINALLLLAFGKYLSLKPIFPPMIILSLLKIIFEIRIVSF